jgi:hypothetical protein
MISRRNVLALSTAIAAAVPGQALLVASRAEAVEGGVGSGSVAAERLERRSPKASQRPPARRAAAARGAVLHVLRRTTYGPTPASIAEVTSRGTAAWLERQLDPSSIPDPQGEAIHNLYPEAGWTIPQVYRAVASRLVTRYSWDVMEPLGQFTLAMATWSSRQLLEVMVEFWSNHLNVANPSDGVWDNRQDYDRRVIRAHALGKFSSMLAASAAHPAMLSYLNQADSTRTAPNENYGRELLELHTVGVDAGYSEAMVLDSARIMTGYTIQGNERSPHFREFRYDPSIHWTGHVRVLGFTHRNATADGRPVVDAYIDYLAHHPATARNIARKLAVRFVSDHPPESLVTRLASTYLVHDTAVAPVLRTLFASHEFHASRGTKVRRPFDDLVATLRTLGYRLLPPQSGVEARRKGPEALYWISASLQQAPLAWVQPDGYPDAADAWASAGGLLHRWNMHQELAAGWWPAKDRIVVPHLPGLLPRRLTSYGALVDSLASRLTGEPLSARDAAAVLTFLDKSPSARVRANDSAVSWDLSRTVALLLDSANHQQR